MAFQVSPGINVSEIDLTTTVPALATSVGAIGGVFGWGPVGKFVLVDSENTLVSRYGKPTNGNYETFFSAANFLSYGNALYVSRAAVTTDSSILKKTMTLTSGSADITITGINHGFVVGQVVFGPGIQSGTVVTNVVESTNTTVTLSKAATISGSSVLNFFAAKTSFNAIANTSAVTLTSTNVKNAQDFDDKGASNTTFAGTQFVARYPGELGNSLKVVVVDNAEQYERSIVLNNGNSVYGSDSTGTDYQYLNELGSATISIAVNSNEANVSLFWLNSASNLLETEAATAAETILASLSVGDYIEVGNITTGTQTLKIKSLPAGISSTDSGSDAYKHFTITFEDTWNRAVDFSGSTLTRKFEYFNTVTAPATSKFATDAGSTVVDEISVIVVDEDGKWTGVPGTILEVYENLSRATDAKTDDGAATFYKTVINENSRYVWATNDLVADDTAPIADLAATTSGTPYIKSFVGGRDGLTETSSATDLMQPLADAYDLFADPTDVDVSLVITGKSVNGTQLANYLIDNIAEARKDCVVFISPEKSDVVGTGVEGLQATNVVSFRGGIHNTSYAFLDSGYKYQYDKYNDVYRYVPLNGDIAGLTARSDDIRDPWFSPAGYTRGQIKNLVKLAYNPTKADRDLLYKNDINPVITQPGQGTILFGDKTALGRPSAFDRINVRRLFIVLEKTIATAANQMLFEFNDEFSRAQFRNLVEPFLREVQGRRGIYDFRVVCDESNNTAEVIDTNRFVGDIYIKPAKSINFIQLNFVAVRSGVEFNEVVGRF